MDRISYGKCSLCGRWRHVLAHRIVSYMEQEEAVVNVVASPLEEPHVIVHELHIDVCEICLPTDVVLSEKMILELTHEFREGRASLSAEK